MEKRTILEARNIHKSFDFPTRIPILKGVNLTVCSGDTIAITGRSGEGKSTLLHILGTLDKPNQGELFIAGQNTLECCQTSLRNRHIGFIFQSFHLLEDYSTLDNILMPARIARKNVSKGSEAYRKGEELLRHVGLTDRAGHNVKQLSGGEKQRVAIARALFNDPDLILADEPSGNLDRQNAQMVHDLILNYVKEHNKALIVVTHDQNLAKLCDRQYELKNCGIVECESGW